MARSTYRTLILSLAAGLAVAIAAPRMTAQTKQPDTVVLKGAPMGGVKFNHTAHVKFVGTKCETCHHASKAEKPLKEKQQKCSDCHTKTVEAPMKTNVRGAFHDAMAKKGTCVDCHLTEGPKGKKTPAKCPDCHKKENV